MSEINKRHNRKIWRACPVCKGRVVLGYRNQNWWVYCEYDASHIPQRFFPHPYEAIEAWNIKGNKMTNADLIRAMTDKDLADFLAGIEHDACCASTYLGDGTYIDNWLDWLKEEANE